MRVVIIGSGNVASVLGRRILLAGHPIVQLVGRHPGRTALLAGQLGCPYGLGWAAITPDAEFYLVALSDSALFAFAADVTLPGKLVAHTAGAVPCNVLLSCSRHSGVLYPLQSLRKGTDPIPEIPILIDANDPGDLERIVSFAGTLSDTVRMADDPTRLKLHLAGVLVNNFTNHLYTQAAAFCEAEGIDFDLLLPLIRETAGRLSYMHPAEAQTGPAARRDQRTIDTHLKLLNNYKNIRELYKLFTIQIEENGIA
ncbi:MAG: DUF2520 domain-containing protein [Bacteroidota bacterium]|nr:DUF2520 domain-containing protein [Bacteroidota bacterium]MDP4216131.1 DUF2520 domain-containing protein [Bacteroidota bacterium]